MIKSIEIETAQRRGIVVAAVLICLAAAFVFAKWCFADAIAAHTPLKEVAALSVDLAPADPQAHYALAVLNDKTFQPEDAAQALAEFERATALSPHDYRLWRALGEARERSGENAGAELAFRKALELAPNYAEIQWALGNFLLRRGKTEEGFAEIRKAADNNAVYRNPAISTAWQVFDGNLADIKRNIGGSAILASTLASSLASQKRFDEAIEIWNGLPDEQKRGTLKESGEQLFGALLAAKKYRAALRIRSGFAPQSADEIAVGKIRNGGFESDVKRGTENVFDWNIADGVQPQIGFDDAQKVGGSRSLVVIFNSWNGKDFRQVSQLVPVEPTRKYAFEFSCKSELKTAATLHWEIVSEPDGKILATTAPASIVSDWTKMRAEFTTSADAEAVTVRLARESCKSTPCPITGKIWFDDFSIN